MAKKEALPITQDLFGAELPFEDIPMPTEEQIPMAEYQPSEEEPVVAEDEVEFLLDSTPEAHKAERETTEPIQEPEPESASEPKEEPQPQYSKHKLFYSIAEVAQMLELKETQLRFWESFFPTIHPRRNPRGIRQYTIEDINAIRLVKHLVNEKGLKLEGAREYIRCNKGRKEATTSTVAEVVERLRNIRTELQIISRNLSGLE